MIKSYSDATLMSLTKAELIEHLRCAEHNRDAIEQRLEQHIENVKDWQPVVHGHWEKPHWRNSDYCWNCSVCGNEAVHKEFLWHKNNIYPYCPNCGAKMDEVKE